MVSAIGRHVVAFLAAAYDLSALIAGMFSSLVAIAAKGARPVIQVCLRQIYFTGREAFTVIFVIAITVGVAVVAQMANVTDAGRGSLIGKLFVWVLLRELGPLISAMVVIARSGSAIAIELGQMKFNREIQYLETLGIPGEHYLLMPRILGAGIALVTLNIYFNLLAVASGLFVAWIRWHIPLSLIKQGIISVLSLSELLISCGKSALFGIIIAAVSCRAGLGVGDSITQIPQAGTRAVILAMIIVFVTNVLLSLLFIY